MKVEAPLDGATKTRQKTFFDTLGRAHRTEASDNSGGNCLASEALFDEVGRAWKQSNPFRCSGSASKWSETIFDGLGRTKEVKAPAPDASKTTYTYATKFVTIKDATGKERKSETDALGRLKKVYEPDVNNPTQLTVETSYAHNMLDLLTTVTQGDQTRSYTYDDLGRVKTVATPETKHQGQQEIYSYVYNAFNLVTQRTDARGVITTYGYDSHNRLQSVSYNVGSTGVPATASVTYTYGSASDPDPNKRGRLLSVADGVGSESYTYSTLGRITQVQKVISSTTYTTSYQYNDAGEVKQITYPSGRVVDQTYDSVGRLASIYSGATQYVNTFAYDLDSSQLTAFKYGSNAVDATFSYAADRLQLTALSYKKNGEANPFFSLTYGYGAAGSNNGQITSITDNVDGGRTVSYTYDALHRLKTAVTSGSAAYPQWGLSWTYDRYGNRTAQSVTHGTAPSNLISVDTATNRLTGAPYAYDKNGNMTNDGLNSLTYDTESRVVSAAGATYSYDGASLRVKKVSGGNTTVYIFAGSRVFAEYVNGAAVGSPTREYIYAGAQLVATHDGGSLKFHYHDHLSARVTSDSAGGNRTEQAHYPYGEQWYNASGAKLLFTSYERDSESGNDYAIFRAHIPRLGRFNRPDPLAGNIYNPQRLNRYAYVLNDVVNLADPLGLDEGPFGPPPDPNDLPITIRRTVWFIHGQSGGFGAGGIVGQLLNTGNENQQGGDPPPAPPPDFSNLWTPNIPNPPVAKDPTNCLIRGMLDTIAWAEGTSGDADGGYGRIVFGTVVSANDPALVGQTNARVTDFSDHPNALVQVNANLRSTAAGRYQFLNRTWESLQRIAPAALPNFGRASQDWGAVMLMAGRNMIAPLLMGNIRQAITNGNVEWASLPNSPHGQPTVGMSAALNTFNRAFWDCIRR